MNTGTFNTLGAASAQENQRLGIPESLEELSHEICALDQALSLVKERLRPICRYHDEVEVDKTNRPQRQGRSPLENELISFSESIKTLRQRLDILMENLQL